MSKLLEKLISVMILIVLLVVVISVCINTVFVEKYYLRDKKNVLETAYKNSPIEDENVMLNTISKLEKEYGITILTTQFTKDEIALNDSLKSELISRGVNIKKFWMTDRIVDEIYTQGTANMIFNQGTLNYSVLVKFVGVRDTLYAYVMTIPHVTETIEIVNRFNIIIIIGMCTSIVIFMSMYLRKIIRPLAQLSVLAEDIAQLDFKQVDIQTGDEIEDLANNINIMSKQLEASHRALNEHNNQLKRLMSDISHELKTPIALVKAYGEGIKDGMDDGSFIDTILEQNDEMNLLVERLLSLSRVYNQTLNIETIDLSEMIKETVEKISFTSKDEVVQLELSIEDSICILGDKNNLQSVFNNLVTNAFKYTASVKVSITLKQENNKVYFNVSNGIISEQAQAFEKVWEPFYVLEESRNKYLSGTGLGLPIVKAILDKHDVDYGYRIVDETVIFYVVFDLYKQIS
ncbi:MAG: sensor histidine kinase [Cellulosilyticaceae bacterium]